MTDDQKKELFPFFAYVYSQKINPEKYGAASSVEEWSQLLQENSEDIDTITKAAEEMSDEDWDTLNKQYSEQRSAEAEEKVQYAKKGAKLKKLSAMKSKKCKCGCAMITSKEKGGSLVSKCACGCNVAKKEDGGEIKSSIVSDKLEKVKNAPKLKPALKKLPTKKK